MLLDDGPDGAIDIEDAAPAEVDAPEPAAEEPATRVSIAPRLSRAQKAAKELQDSIDARLTKQSEEHERALSSIRDELRAARQQPVYVQQPQQQAPAAAQPDLPDPEALFKEANAALDAKDFTTYQRKQAEASAAIAMRQMMPRFQQSEQERQRFVQQASANQVNPGLMAKILAHPDVAAHPNHMALLGNKAEELRIRYGDTRNANEAQARVARIFSEVDGMIKGEKNASKPSYSQSSAAALSGVPTASGRVANGGNGEPGVELTADEKRVAIKSGMGLTRYAAQVAKMNPERIRR